MLRGTVCQYGRRAGKVRQSDFKNRRTDRTGYEFYEYIANVIQAAEQRVDVWRRSSSQTVQYLFHLYSDPDYLEKVLASKGRWKLYTTDGGFFYMASEGEIESHRPSEDNANEETIGLERLFGDSWFSEKARYRYGGAEERVPRACEKVSPRCFYWSASCRYFQGDFRRIRLAAME